VDPSCRPTTCLKALLDDMHVCVTPKCSREHNHHSKCNQYHDNDDIIRRVETQISVGESGTTARVVGDVLVKTNKQSTEEEADEQELTTGCHAEIHLPSIRIARQDGDKKRDGDDQRRQQSNDL